MAITTENSNIENSLLITNGDEQKISAKVQVNLQSYIDTFNEEGPSGPNFQTCRTELIDNVSGLSGHLFWERILGRALENVQFSSQQQSKLKNTPACQYMYDGFIEILKNVMDEAILGYYDNGIEPQLELTLDIDLSTPAQISITLADNGRGFPVSFLENNASSQDKDKYIRENKGSSKIDAQNRPPLFGGASLGLRTLMAKTMYGAVLTGPGVLVPKYEKPLISEINFENKAGGLIGEHGAVIRITTSLAPLLEKEVPQMRKDLPILRLPQRKKPIMSSSYNKTNTLLCRQNVFFQQSEKGNDNTEPNGLSHVNMVPEKKLEPTPVALSENLYGLFSEQNNVTFEPSGELHRTITVSSN